MQRPWWNDGQADTYLLSLWVYDQDLFCIHFNANASVLISETWSWKGEKRNWSTASEWKNLKQFTCSNLLNFQKCIKMSLLWYIPSHHCFLTARYSVVPAFLFLWGFYLVGFSCIPERKGTGDALLLFLFTFYTSMFCFPGASKNATRPRMSNWFFGCWAKIFG